MKPLFLCALVCAGVFAQSADNDPDRGMADQIRFSQTGDVYHFAMGSAGTFYNSDGRRRAIANFPPG